MASIFAEIPDFSFAPQETPAFIRTSLADQVAAGVVTDTGVSDPEGGNVMLHHIRVRLVIKSGMANTNTFAVRVKVDDDYANFASPEVVAQSRTYTFVTGDGYITMDLYGYSHTGFRAFKLFGTNSGGTAVYDAIVDCW